MRTKFPFYLSSIVLILVLLTASNNNLLGLEIETSQTYILEELEENNDLLEEYTFIVDSFRRNNNSLLKFAYIENCMTNNFLDVEYPPPRTIDLILRNKLILIKK